MSQRNLNIGLEIKALNQREFEGHGSVFGNVDLGGDVVMPGAFQKSLAMHKQAGTLPQMFWMHDMSRVPGRWTEMREDEKGLFVRGELADTELGREMHTLLKMKAVRGLSIGYQVMSDDYKGGARRLKEIDLWEVSLVSLAMNPLAQVEAAKSRLSAIGEYVPTEEESARDERMAIAAAKRAFEDTLKGWGYSTKTAQTLVARHFEIPPEAISGGNPLSDSEVHDPDAAQLIAALKAFELSAWEGVFRA